jgi:hypothetical protein
LYVWRMCVVPVHIPLLVNVRTDMRVCEALLGLILQLVIGLAVHLLQLSCTCIHWVNTLCSLCRAEDTETKTTSYDFRVLRTK